MSLDTTDSNPIQEEADLTGAGEFGKSIVDNLRELDAADVVDNTREWTRDNPLAALGIALGAGVVLGILVRSAIADEEPEETGPRRLAHVIRDTSNELVHKARQASSDVVSEVSAKFNSIEAPSVENIAKQTTSFADTVVAGLTATISRKVSDWLTNR